MPKEFIECADFGRTVPVVTEEGKPPEFAALDTFAAKVGWTRGHEHVEVAIVECVEGAYDEHGFDHSGQPTGRGTPRYMQLDRAGINRLIRTLRKARDQAYGSDA